MDREAQRAKVRIAQESKELVAGDEYNVISQKWWSSWCDFVDYEKKNGEEEEERSVHPGPISNEPLCETVLGQSLLRKDLVERDDYVFISREAWTLLAGWYGGGPELRRTVLQLATEPYVEVNLLRIEVRRVNEDDGLPTTEGKALELSKADDAWSARRRVLDLVGLKETDRARIWAKAAAVTDVSSSSRALDEEQFWRATTGEGEGESWRSWELLVLGDGGSIDDEAKASKEKVGSCKSLAAAREALRWGMLVEVQRDRKGGASSKVPASLACWPFEMRRERWRDSLKVGDLVDALDSENIWYDSVVADANDEEGTLRIHFRGWNKKWDSWMNRYDTKTLQPLFTHTDDWRKFRVGDGCEFSTDDANPLWYEATVAAVYEDGAYVDLKLAHPRVADGKKVKTSSERLCKLGTHLKRHRNAQSSQHKAALLNSSGHSSTLSSSRPSSSVHYPSSGLLSRGSGRTHVRGTPPAPGAVGLSNLGNTCFMNSMLQCLSHTSPLTAYFRDDSFVRELNVENPLGSGGQIARAYADFVRDAWSGDYSVVVPTALKKAIGKHAPQFSGYQQQDSQELMNYLLDGLHEDLNRVRNKPYTETLESNGRPDEEVAKESWRRFQQRNQSIIVDTCYGQLRSHITCPLCKHESITFDPYLSLSLPLPSATTRHVAITLVTLDVVEKPVEYQVAVGTRDSVGALKDALLDSAFGIGHNKRRTDVDICDVWANRIHRTLSDNESVERVKQTDKLVAFELDPLQHQQRDDSTTSMDVDEGMDKTPPVRQRRRYVVDILFWLPLPAHAQGFTDALTRGAQSISSKVTGRPQSQLSGTPLRLSFYGTTTCRELREKIASRVKPRVKKDPQPMDTTGLAEPILRSSSSNNSGSNSDGGAEPYKISMPTTAWSHPRGSSRSSFVELPNDETPAIEALRSGSKVSSVADSLWTLSLEWSRDAVIEINDESSETTNQANGSKNERSTKRINIVDCFRKLAEREQLGETEQWYCSKCKQHSRAFKKLDLWSTPEILIVHLKRFQFAQNTYFVHRSKLDDLVEFPLTNLDLSQHILSKETAAKYNLYAVSEHSGGLGGGHYTATVLDEASAKWYHYNDSMVSRADASTVSCRSTNSTPLTCYFSSQVVSQQAYVLFYRRVRESE